MNAADARLIRSIDTLVNAMGMLTGLAVCYGTKDQEVIHLIGHQQEVIFDGAQFQSAPKPITPNTLYDIASLTKLFTLVSVLRLVDQGALKLDDSIAKLDPRFIHLKDCTVEDCLNYTAALKTPERVDAQQDAAAARAMVFETRRVPLSGMRLYSDMNALVLKYVIESVSGTSYYNFLRQQVLTPAGMNSTFANVPESRLQDVMNYNYEHKIISGNHHIEMKVLPGLPHDPKARLLKSHPEDLSGHAGLFSTAQDLCRFCQALLKGALLPLDMVKTIGINRTGYLSHDGEYRQFLGLLAFSKSPIQRMSEVPEWMGLRAFGISGYTGKHFALDPDRGVFDLLLGNRCHNRLSAILPDTDAPGFGIFKDEGGTVTWPDGREVRSSIGFIHQKDRMVHNPVHACLVERNWL